MPSRKQKAKEEGRNFEMSCCSCEHIEQYRKNHNIRYACSHPDRMIYTALMPLGYARPMTGREYETKPKWCPKINTEARMEVFSPGSRYREILGCGEWMRVSEEG